MEDFIVLGLAVWRLSSLLVTELGPYAILERFRHTIGIRINSDTLIPYGQNEFAELFTCIWCLSFWIAIITTLFYLVWPRAVVIVAIPFALSAGAILVERIVRNDNVH